MSLKKLIDDVLRYRNEGGDWKAYLNELGKEIRKGIIKCSKETK